jgi:hypothetical protein
MISDEERVRMIEELTEREMYSVNYMEAMNTLFNLFAAQFEALDDDELKARYFSAFSSNAEVH